MFISTTAALRRTASDAGGGLDFGIAFSRFSELRFDYQLEHLSLTRSIGIPDC
jgi:hypothetical protein